MLYFQDYQEQDEVLLFAGRLNSIEGDTFNVRVKQKADQEITVKIDSQSYSFKKVDDGKMHCHMEIEELSGSTTERASEAAVAYLQLELQNLSDSSVSVGTLSNRFSGRNNVSIYIVYTGTDHSVKSIRSALLTKIIEMNGVADKYRLLDGFTVNSYSEEMPGVTERKTDQRVNNWKCGQ